MPFGQKPDGSGGVIDFNAVYSSLVKPAAEQAGLEPVRADEEQSDGFMHKLVYERLLLSDFALIDLTGASANAFYKLGVRHAVKPQSTISIFAEGGRLPFAIPPDRAFAYRIEGGKPADLETAISKLAALLAQAQQPSSDNPIAQLVEDFPEIQHTKTDVFRDRVQYSIDLKQRLAAARTRKPASAALADLQQIESELDVDTVEFAVLVDLLLSYRDVKGWAQMIALAGRVPAQLALSVMVQEQLAFALNRAGQPDQAEKVLLDLIAARGPSTESLSLLGRIYKDRWDAAVKSGDAAQAAAFLTKAIDTYTRGFETDWRDAYPGINAVTLMELQQPPDPRRLAMVPVVRYSVDRRLAGGQPDYWDHATLIELAILAKDRDAAYASLDNALSVARAGWELETTLRNLKLIDQARQARGEAVDWYAQIESTLTERIASFA